MAVNYRWGMKSNINRVIDDYRIDQNPMYGISRGEIGGSYTTKFLSDFAYADFSAGYAASSTEATLYRLDNQLTRWADTQSGSNRTTGLSARYNTTYTFENGGVYSILCIGAGGGAAATGSNRGGGGGAGGGLMYLNFTASSTFNAYIFVGAPGVTAGSSTTASGTRGGNSFVSINTAESGAICGAGGGEGGTSGPASGVGGSASGGLGGQTFATNWSGRVTGFGLNTSADGDGGLGGESRNNNAGGGGGGAGGYSGVGGSGGSGNANTGVSGGSGGAGGGGGVNSSNCGGGGGVGIFGQGSSGASAGSGTGGRGGSGGTNGTVGNNASDGGEYGGGGGADDDDFTSSTSYNGTGGRGCVVILRGYGTYPSTISAVSSNVNTINIGSSQIAAWVTSSSWVT